MTVMSKQSKAPLGASLVVLSSVFYASYGIWTKLMGEFFGGYTASALRSVLVLLILAPIALFYRALEPINFKQNGRYLVGMVLASLFTWGPLYYAILHAGVGMSLAINYASIIIGTFFFGWLLAGEKFTKDKIIATALGMVGLGFIFSPSTASLGWLALIAAVLSGISVGANSVFAKQVRYNATQSTLVLWVASVVANIPMAFLFREVRPDIGWHSQWLYLVFFAIASVVASWTLIKGLKLIEAGAAGILGLLEIVFGVLFGAVFFHERPGGLMLTGVVIIIAAAAIPYVKDYNAKRGTLG
jgi:drug/metabolite transporter (DMT)-like permease